MINENNAIVNVNIDDEGLKLVNKLIEALVWCSGSEDFQEGGKAREGWLKIKNELLDNTPTVEQLSPSEAVYGFAGWLTTQEESITAGANHNCCIWAEKVDEFCKTNNLETPRDHWEKRLIHPVKGRK